MTGCRGPRQPKVKVALSCAAILATQTVDSTQRRNDSSPELLCELTGEAERTEATVFVLLVEDEPLILLGMQDALEGGGYSVLTATNGGDAVALLDGRHSDIAGVITDIRLGSGPGGWEVARHVRQLKPEIAVVYVSGDSVEDWPSEGLPNTIAVQKPFAEAQLVTAISNLITAAAGG